MSEPRWIAFIPASPKPRTKVWDVVSRKEDFGSMELGQVKWYGCWRKYAFFPAPQTVFEQDCLRDIADFCEEKTQDHRAARASTRHPAPETRSSPEALGGNY